MRHDVSCIASAMLLLAIFLLVVMPAAGEDGYPKTIADCYTNRTVTIDEPVERIVLLLGTAHEPVYILGQEDKIVGTMVQASKCLNFLSGIEDLPVLGTYAEHDYEKIIELNPDLVIVYPNYAEPVYDALSGTGIEIATFKFNDQNRFADELRTLADMIGGEEKAEEFLSWRQEYLDLLEDRTADIEPDERCKVYVEYVDTGPWYSSGKNSPPDGRINRADGVNIAGDISVMTPEVSPEWVLESNPQAMIFLSTDDFSPPMLTNYFMESTDNASSFLDETAMRSGLSGTDAVKENHLYVMDQFLMASAARDFIASMYLAKWFYPDKFEDFDPEEVHREYFEEWLGVPYHGVWAYPLGS